MKSDIKILKILLSKKEEKFTIKKISDTAKINYRIAHEQSANLEKEGLIKITKIGNYKICELTQKFNSKIFEAEESRKQDILKNKDLLIIHTRLAELKFPFIALLFGSQAKGKSDKQSDIDILTVGGDEKEIKSAISLLPDKIHLTALTSEEFLQMAKSGEFTVVSEAIKNNIILIGTEEYYRMMSNA